MGYTNFETMFTGTTAPPVADPPFATEGSKTLLSHLGAVGSEQELANSPTLLSHDTTASPAFGTEQTLNVSRFDINLNAGTKKLTLYFNKFADVSTLDVTKITIQDAATLTLFYTLTDSSSVSADGQTVVIDLSATDYAGITGIPGLADSDAHTWLTIAANAIQDMSAVGNAVIADGSAINVDSYTGV